HKCSTPTTFTPIPTSTIIPCCQPGNPAFQSRAPITLHSAVHGTSVPSAGGDAQKCCESCFNDSNCAQWLLAEDRCINFGHDDACNNPVTPLGPLATNGGILRCSDGCL
ncbi:12528_t:CDS:1, partial [Racocetra persica]